MTPLQTLKLTLDYTAGNVVVPPNYTDVIRLQEESPGVWTLGLVMLAVVQLVGLNAEAWRQRHALAERRAEMTALFKSAHPQTPTVYDAPVQMQRETDALRAAAGRAGEADLEALLQAAASAWPGQQPVQALNYEPGKLTLAAPGWNEAQFARMRETLAPAGWRVESGEGRVTLSRATGGPTAPRT